MEGGSHQPIHRSVDDFEKVSYLYPNPTTDFIIADLENIQESGMLEIHNAFGRLVLSEQIGAAEIMKEIDVSQLANGIYYTTFRTQKGALFSEKFVKQ